MKREIKFRGKRLDNGDLIYGDLTHNFGDEYIQPNTFSEIRTGYRVDPATIGQYTGLKDKDGVEIYEGDIVEHTFRTDKEIRTGVVTYVDSWAAFFIVGSGYSDNQMFAFGNFKVIGNIYDNPELLNK